MTLADVPLAFVMTSQSRDPLKLSDAMASPAINKAEENTAKIPPKNMKFTDLHFFSNRIKKNKSN